MTCIVAHRSGWMVADRISLFGGHAFSTDEKIVSLGHTLLAASGESGFKQRIAKVLENTSQEAVPEVLSDHLSASKPDVNVLLVNKIQKLIVFDECGARYYPSCDLWAIGSGADLVIGFMAGRGLDTAAGAQEAIRWAACRLTTISKDSVTVSL